MLVERCLVHMCNYPNALDLFAKWSAPHNDNLQNTSKYTKIRVILLVRYWTQFSRFKWYMQTTLLPMPSACCMLVQVMMIMSMCVCGTSHWINIKSWCWNHFISDGNVSFGGNKKKTRWIELNPFDYVLFAFELMSAHSANNEYSRPKRPFSIFTCEMISLNVDFLIG